MLYNGNVTLNIFLYKKRLLLGVYKYLLYKFYIAGEFVPWFFAKLQKLSLGLLLSVLKPIGQWHKKEMFSLNLWKILWDQLGT